MHLHQIVLDLEVASHRISSHLGELHNLEYFLSTERYRPMFDTDLVATNSPATGDVCSARLNLLCHIIAQALGQIVVVKLDRRIAFIHQQVMHDVAIGGIDHCLMLQATFI